MTNAQNIIVFICLDRRMVEVETLIKASVEQLQNGLIECFRRLDEKGNSEVSEIKRAGTSQPRTHTPPIPHGGPSSIPNHPASHVLSTGTPPEGED